MGEVSHSDLVGEGLDGESRFDFVIVGAGSAGCVLALMAHSQSETPDARLDSEKAASDLQVNVPVDHDAIAA